MKKTLKAIEAKEEELLETVERPFHWVQRHWLPVTVVVLVVLGSIGGWRYHLYTTEATLDSAWEELDASLVDPSTAQDSAKRVEALSEFLEKDRPDSVRGWALVELSQLHESAGNTEEARKVLRQLVDQFGGAEDGKSENSPVLFARSRLDALDQDSKWDTEHGRKREAVHSGGVNPLVEFRTTKGVIEIELYEDHVPNSTANLISLVESGFYTGCSVHRVVPNAEGGVVQWGRRFNLDKDMSADEEGPGYRIKAEIHPDLHNEEGAVSMARTADDYDSAGSQIFINTRDNRSGWDGRYTVVGKVTKGMDVVNLLTADEDFILNAVVTRKREQPYEVQKLPLR